MTAQCKACKDLVIPPRLDKPDPLGMLEIRALADSVRNHYMIYHPKELSSVAASLLLLQSRIMLTMVDCEDAGFKEKAKQLTGVLVALFQEADAELDVVITPPPALVQP